MVNIPSFTGFHTSQVVWDFWTINSKFLLTSFFVEFCIQWCSFISSKTPCKKCSPTTPGVVFWNGSDQPAVCNRGKMIRFSSGFPKKNQVILMVTGILGGGWAYLTGAVSLRTNPKGVGWSKGTVLPRNLDKKWPDFTPNVWVFQAGLIWVFQEKVYEQSPLVNMDVFVYNSIYYKYKYIYILYIYIYTHKYALELQHGPWKVSIFKEHKLPTITFQVYVYVELPGSYSLSNNHVYRKTT